MQAKVSATLSHDTVMSPASGRGGGSHPMYALKICAAGLTCLFLPSRSVNGANFGFLDRDGVYVFA